VPSPQRRPALTKAPARDHPVAPPAQPRPRLNGDDSATTTAATGAGVVGEGPPGQTAMLSARVPAELRDLVKLHAVHHRTSVQAVVIAAMEHYLRE